MYHTMEKELDSQVRGRAKFGRPGGARAGYNINRLPLKLEGAADA
jgi:hypothetical protein